MTTTMTTLKMEMKARKEQKKALREAKIATWPTWAQYLYNFGAGLFGGSSVGIGLFIGGMFASMSLLMIIGVYFDIDFIVNVIYNMADFYAAVEAGTFTIENFGMDTILEISNFLLISMFLGYIPTFIYMFSKKDLDGGYKKDIDFAQLFKYLTVFYIINLGLEIVLNQVAAIPALASANADLASVNLLATEGNIWLCLAVTGFGAAVSEEISLRYFTQRSMYKVGPAFAIIWQAVLFGLLHGNLFQGFFATVMGVLLGIIYYKTNNLWYTTIIHIVNNSLAVLITQFGINSYVAYTILPILFYGAYELVKAMENKKSNQQIAVNEWRASLRNE